MKILLSIIVLTAALFSLQVYAVEPTHTVAQTIQAERYSTVKLRGKIISRIDDKRYLFEDETGTLELKIDKKAQQDLVVPTPGNVFIYGKVDHYGKKTEVDVKSIIK